ncbi:MAG: BREX-1 system phosphatase PglZ type A, partial [Peptostreptococcaceae bacterium]
MINSDANEFDKYISVIRHRQPLHFYNEYKNYYEAIKNAVELLKIKDSLEYGIREQNPTDMINKYYKDDINGYYLIDKAYRKFYVAFYYLSNKDLLITLRDKVEYVYSNWYLDGLSMKWSNSLSENLNGDWRIPSILPQKMFYSNFVETHTMKNERVFVVISDGLRYESAKELSEILNNEKKGSTDITAMLGSLPSITKLGMASLLPNKKITIKNDNVYVDDTNTQGTENRDKILKAKNKDSIAITYNSIKDLSTKDLRELFNGKKVIYIYHNTIDAVGDDAQKERNVFDAVEDTFIEIKTLIDQLVNRVSATNIYITSDHGFLYKRGSLGKYDKISITSDNSYGRRYSLSDNKEEQMGVLTFSMDYLLGNNSNMYVNSPKGEIRFAKQGAGANYVHGGASLQEVVVPVIKYKNSRVQGDNVPDKVDVELQSTNKKITTNEPYITFFQRDRVEDKRLPRILKVYLENEYGEKVSSEGVIVADSTSSNIEERLYKIKLTLKSIEYDRKNKYY